MNEKLYRPEDMRMNVELTEERPTNTYSVICGKCRRSPDRLRWHQHERKDSLVLWVECHHRRGMHEIPMIEIIATPNIVVFAPLTDDEEP